MDSNMKDNTKMGSQVSEVHLIVKWDSNNSEIKKGTRRCP